MTIFEKKQCVEPKYVCVPDFCSFYGVGRSTAYKLLRTGKVLAVKLGKRTLVDLESARDYFGTLPSFKGGAR